MIEITDTDSQPYVFKTAHGNIEVQIRDGRLFASAEFNNLAVIPRADNSLCIHVVRLDRIQRLYEPG